MEMLFVLLVLLVVMAISAVAVSSMHRRETAFKELASGEKAFDEVIRVKPYDSTQLRRLRPLVEQVGIVRVSRSLDVPDYEYLGDPHHVFVLDTLGEVHDVYEGSSEAESMQVARRLSEDLDAEMVER